MRCYGVVGMASKNLIGGIADLFQPERWGRGVDVHVRDGQVIVDLYRDPVWHAHLGGCQPVMHGVKYALEQAMGIPVAEVNVHVQGLRMLNDTK